MEDKYIIQVIYSSERPSVKTFPNNTCGGGLFIDNFTVVTCAHVINAALGLADKNIDRPDSGAIIKIKFTHNEQITGDIICQIREWYYKGTTESDLAILKVIYCNPQDDAELRQLPVNKSITVSNTLWNHEFKAFGFPSMPGIWANGTLLSEVNGGLFQLKSDDIKANYSGFPVYDMELKSYVGLVGYGFERTDISFMLSFKTITKSFAEINQYINRKNTDEPAPPPNVVYRKELIAEIHTAINKDNKLAFILAPSGYGKTILSNTFYKEFQGGKYYFNCRIANEIPNVKDGELIVIDEIYEEHPIVEWVNGKPNCFILITTKSKFICQKLLRNRNLLKGISSEVDLAESIVEVSGFTFEEARTLFLFCGCGPEIISDEEIKEYVQHTNGCPIAIRGLINILCKDDCSKKLVLESNNNIDVERNFKNIIQQDLELSNTTLSEILEILSNVPFVGMSEIVISFITEKPTQTICESLSKIIALGYVTQLKNNRFGNLYTTHDLIKKVFQISEDGEISLRIKRRNWDKKYFQFLVENKDSLDILSTIDALVSGLRSVFKIISENDVYNQEDIKRLNEAKSLEELPLQTRQKYIANRRENDYFNAELNKTIGMINDILRTKVISSHQQILVMDFFRSSIQTSSCSELIALGQAFSGMPKNPMLGTTIWEGVSNYDSWAAAACLRAAAYHWSSYDSFTIQETAMPKFKNWLLNCRMPDGADLDISSAVGGLCLLNGIPIAIETVLSRAYRNKVGQTLISDLRSNGHFSGCFIDVIS